MVRHRVFEPTGAELELACSPVEILFQGQPRSHDDVQVIPLDEFRQQVDQRLARARSVDIRDVRASGEHLADTVSLLVVEEVGLGVAVELPETLEEAAVVQRNHLGLFHLRGDTNRSVASLKTAAT